jgi:hypothetical protein
MVLVSIWKQLYDVPVDQFALGFGIGLIVGAGNFSGDRQQPALQIRMQRRDVAALELLRRELGGRVFGPYAHEGRDTYLYLLRGPELRDALPVIEQNLPDSWKRVQFEAWRAKYSDYFDRPRPSPALLDRMERILSPGHR